jgi:hypothetical protein
MLTSNHGIRTIPLSLTLVVTPLATSWPSTTALGTIVATLQGVWNNNGAFTGDYVFVAPNMDDGGTYDIVLNGDHSGSLRVAPAGPGVGSDGGTITHVSIAARQ